MKEFKLNISALLGMLMFADLSDDIVENCAPKYGSALMEILDIPTEELLVELLAYKNKAEAAGWDPEDEDKLVIAKAIIRDLLEMIAEDVI